MNWIQNLSASVDYIEKHLTDDLSVDDVASHVYSSSSHFQMIFHMVMGMTIGEYIHSRRI